MVLIGRRRHPRKHPERDTLSAGKRGHRARVAWERRVGYRYWKPVYLWWIVLRPKLFARFQTKKACPVRGDAL